VDTTPVALPCEACGSLVAGDGPDGYVEACVTHVRAEHADWRYPDRAIRRYAAERPPGMCSQLTPTAPGDFEG
jgi:hypothetical protein